jgi:hypothetical protein
MEKTKLTLRFNNSVAIIVDGYKTTLECWDLPVAIHRAVRFSPLTYTLDNTSTPKLGTTWQVSEMRTGLRIHPTSGEKGSRATILAKANGRCSQISKQQAISTILLRAAQQEEPEIVFDLTRGTTNES